jgi:serine/threonine protein phosphatase PrpC
MFLSFLLVLLFSAHFIMDDVFNDGQVGLYGVLDGHGGSEVVESCVEFIPEVFLLRLRHLKRH